MGKSIIDKDELEKAKDKFRGALDVLSNDHSCVLSTLMSVHTSLSESDIWEGAACNVFREKLILEIKELENMEDTLKALISYCEKVDGDLERYVRFIQSLFGCKF